jgi:hypothetical protein
MRRHKSNCTGLGESRRTVCLAGGDSLLENPRRMFVVLFALLLAAMSVAFIAGPQAARAASPQALVLSDSVTVPGPAPASSTESIEQYEAEQDGYTVTSVTGAQWDAMTASQFAQYQVLIIGDPTCDPSGTSFAAAVANKSTWEPVVMGSGGNKVLIGTDPTFHYTAGDAPNAPKLEANGIAFAGAVAGATGAYVDLSCAYDSSSAGTPVPLLDGLSTHGSGQFTVAGESPLGACATGVNVVAQSGPTTGLTDADLSNWNCSVHEAFDKFPSDYTPLALAPSSSGFPNIYCADDVSTGALACGSPYIMVSGGGVVVKSQVTLTPAAQTRPAGGSASLVANVSTTAGPVSAGSVVFSVDSGPDVGKTFTGTTDSSGNTTFTYTNTGGPGTDSISATYTDSHGVSQKATATVTWTAAGKAPVVDDSCNGLGTTSVTTTGLDTTGPNDLVVAYVSADGPAKGSQSVTVSGSGLTWTRVAQENGALGDSEVWMASAGTKTNITVTAAASTKGYNLALTDVSYKNATGIGAHGTFESASGAPTGTITTTQSNSWVWAVGFDWLSAKNRTVGSGQTLFSQKTDKANNTYWVQSTTSPTPSAGTGVTINDTAPTTDPYDLVLVEIL